MSNNNKKDYQDNHNLDTEDSIKFIKSLMNDVCDMSAKKNIDVKIKFKDIEISSQHPVRQEPNHGMHIPMNMGVSNALTSTHASNQGMFHQGINTQNNQTSDTGVSNDNAIKAPLIGILHLQVKENDTVKKGDTIFIIESMKVMNDVIAETDGVVRKILVDTGVAVEYDQDILIIE